MTMTTNETLLRLQREARADYIKSHRTPSSPNGPEEYEEWVEIDSEEIESLVEYVWNAAIQEALGVLPESREIPYERRSPFPSESVDHHLKAYGHLPEPGCCKYDQYPIEDVLPWNACRTEADTRIRALLTNG